MMMVLRDSFRSFTSFPSTFTSKTLSADTGESNEPNGYLRILHLAGLPIEK